ncbi:MAG: hypothetical protein IKP64_08790 [Selenomonadaceae bacterium]|nr:hypothetical protein [Selenomonadaceae bacterium]
MPDKRFLFPLTLLACVLCFFVLQEFVWEPARREILNMQLETRRLREVEREVSELKVRYGDLSAAVAQKERELDAAREFLPSELNAEKFIDALYQSAQTQRAEIISVQSGDIGGEEIQSQTVTVKLEAEYVSLLNFLREILDGKRFATLETVSIDGTGGKILSCELTFKIFAAK